MNSFALPKSSKVVLSILSKGHNTPQQILKESSLPPRTLRFAIKKLKSLGVIEERYFLSDSRKKFYRIKGGINEKSNK